MVKLLDLGEEDVVNKETEVHWGGKPNVDAVNADRPNPNLTNFSIALSCYPIVSQLASLLDLNSLHELSRTCRQFRANLLQYRTLLISQTLRCENEDANPALRLGNALNASFEAWTAYGRNGAKIGRITSGRVGACARDMVGECRKCGRIVCRNCILKPPPPVKLKGRHRRICRTCMKATLDKLMSFVPDNQDGLSSFATDCFTSQAFSRTPCTCDQNVWICQPCATSLRQADTTYIRGWSWRSKYATCGGIGAGLGEGNEGVECGRGSACLAACEVEKEIECDADELAALEAETEKAMLEGRSWAGSSYTTQEIVGLGGVVKRKIKKRVLVGAAVKEYEDERAGAAYFAREQAGVNRSWCSWCERVVLGRKDLDARVGSAESVASSSASE